MSNKKYFSKQNPTDVTIQSEDGGGLTLTNQGKFLYGAKTKEESDKLNTENFNGNVNIDPNTNSSFIAVMNSNSVPVDLNISNNNQYSIYSPNNNPNVLFSKPTSDCKDEFDDLTLELLNHENIYSNGGNNIAVGARNNVVDLITKTPATSPAGINLGWGLYGSGESTFEDAKKNYLDNYWDSNNNKPTAPTLLNANQIYINKLPPGLRSMAIQFSYNAGQWFTRILVAANTIDSLLGYPYETTPNVSFDPSQPVREGNGYEVVRDINGNKTKDKIAVHPKAIASVSVPGVTYFVSPTYDERQNTFIQQYQQIIDLYNKDKDKFLIALRNEHKRFYLAFRKFQTEKGSQQRFVTLPNQFDRFYADYVDKAYKIALKYKDCNISLIPTPQPTSTTQTSNVLEIVDFEPKIIDRATSPTSVIDITIEGFKGQDIQKIFVGNEEISSQYINIPLSTDNIFSISLEMNGKTGLIKIETTLGTVESKEILTITGIKIEKDESLPSNENDPEYIPGVQDEDPGADDPNLSIPQPQPSIPVGDFGFEAPIQGGSGGVETQTRRRSSGVTVTSGNRNDPNATTVNFPEFPTGGTGGTGGDGEEPIDNNLPPAPVQSNLCPGAEKKEVIKQNADCFFRIPSTPGVYSYTDPICATGNLLEAAKQSVGTYTKYNKSTKGSSPGSLGCAFAIAIIYARAFGHSPRYREDSSGNWNKTNTYKGTQSGNYPNNPFIAINNSGGKIDKNKSVVPAQFQSFNQYLFGLEGTAYLQSRLELDIPENFVIVANWNKSQNIPWDNSNIVKYALPGDIINTKTVGSTHGHIGIVSDTKNKFGDGSFDIISNNSDRNITGTGGNDKWAGSIQVNKSVLNWRSIAKRGSLTTYLIRQVGIFGTTI
jgi:hypothetical protein